MTKKEQKLLEIARKKCVGEFEMDYFEDNIEEYPMLWDNLYLWSVQFGNYQVSDYVLECGLDLNKSDTIKLEVIKSYSNYGLYGSKIIRDGFEITSGMYNSILNTYSNDPHFDKDRLKNDNNNSLYLFRSKKIYKLKQNIHNKTI